VERDNASAKFWMVPVSVARSIGFSARELNDLQENGQESCRHLHTRWREFYRTWSR
jgi:hypothetical protein